MFDKNKPDHNDQKKSVSNHIKAKWSKLTDNDIKAIGSDMALLADKVSTVYGRTKADVKKEIEKFQQTTNKS